MHVPSTISDTNSWGEVVVFLSFFFFLWVRGNVSLNVSIGTGPKCLSIKINTTKEEREEIDKG